MTKTILAGVAAAAALCGAAQAQERLPPVPPAQYTADQRAAAAAFEAARNGPVFGPFGLLIRSPNVMTAARQMGDHLRFGSAVGTTLSELAILVTAREWSQDYEWSVHAPIALRQGIRPEVVDAIAQGRRPEGMSADEALVYDFTIELHRNRQVSDATYGRTLARWGEVGVVDLTAINGYYTFLAMALNVGRTPPADGIRLPRLP
jgi:4-carboxymuconolactone decarboxylase